MVYLFRQGFSLFPTVFVLFILGKNSVAANSVSSGAVFSVATGDISITLETESKTNGDGEYLKLLSFPFAVAGDEKNENVRSYDGATVEILAATPTPKTKKKEGPIAAIQMDEIHLQVVYNKKKQIIDLVLEGTKDSVFSKTATTRLLQQEQEQEQQSEASSSNLMTPAAAAPVTTTTTSEMESMENCDGPVNNVVQLVDDLCDFGNKWKKWRKKWTKRNITKKNSQRRQLLQAKKTRALQNVKPPPLGTVTRIARHLSAEQSCVIANFLKTEAQSRPAREFLCDRLGSATTGCGGDDAKNCPDGSCVSKDDCCPGERKCKGDIFALPSRFVCVPVDECCPGCIKCAGQTATPPAGCYETPCCPGRCSDSLFGCDCLKTVQGCCSTLNALELAESNLECVAKELVA